MAADVVPRPVADLPREVYRWLQSLDLSIRVTNVRRDFSNGNLLAKIFSQYYPRVIATHNFINGTSLSTKMSNWYHLQQVISKRDLLLPKHLVNGTLHCKPGAAEALVLFTYSLLTGRIVEQPSWTDLDFTDHAYQRQLPLHARATASQTLKNNIRNSELLAEPGQQHMQRKAQALLLAHQQQRREERRLFPGSNRQTTQSRIDRMNPMEKGNSLNRLFCNVTMSYQYRFFNDTDFSRVHPCYTQCCCT